MKLKDLKQLLKSAPDDSEIKVENGEIVIRKPHPTKHKFKIGDRVCINNVVLGLFTISKQIIENGELRYLLIERPDWISYRESELTLYSPKDITEHIKSFDDAYDWCEEHNYSKLTNEYEGVVRMNHDISYDVIAYMKLRIITCALNEGWEPTFDPNERRWYVYYDLEKYNRLASYEDKSYNYQRSTSLMFKSERLAEYAARQFRDIYGDFSGVKK